MGWFKEEAQPEAAKPEAQTWDDKMKDAEPRRTQYFKAIRTDAYENINPVSNYIEFWSAIQVDKTEDTWRIMHYMIHDLDKEDGLFKSTVVSKSDISFPQAVYELAKYTSMASTMGKVAAINLSEKYPAESFPELKVYFYDLANYKEAANIEGIALDTADHPYRRIEGKVFATATFNRSDIQDSITAAEDMRQNPVVLSQIEKGITLDIFNSAAAPGASLGDILKAGKSLACLDDFAVQMGAFYLGVQKLVGKKGSFDTLEGLTAEEKATLSKKASALSEDYDAASILPQALEKLQEAKDLGIYTEPFEKHVAECELYLLLLDASQKFVKFKSSLSSANGVDMSAQDAMQKSVKNAQAKFKKLGGTDNQFDRLQAWIANDRKEIVPPWVTTWFERYYEQRRKAMEKVQARKTSPAAVNTLPAEAKPPIVK